MYQKKKIPTVSTTDKNLAAILREVRAYLNVIDFDKHNAPTAELCASIAEEIPAFHEFQARAWLSESSREFGLHNDSSEVFCIHLLGGKKWRISDRPADYRRHVAEYDKNNFFVYQQQEAGKIIPKKEFLHIIIWPTKKSKPVSQVLDLDFCI